MPDRASSLVNPRPNSRDCRHREERDRRTARERSRRDVGVTTTPPKMIAEDLTAVGEALAWPRFARPSNSRASRC
jgi:hypothetical protein